MSLRELRHAPSAAFVAGCLDAFKRDLARRLEKHGPGIYVTPHETAGVLAEEWDEFKDALRDHANGHASIEKELMDLAVGAFWGYVSSRTGHQDW